MTMNPSSLLLGRTFQDRRSRVMWGLPGCLRWWIDGLRWLGVIFDCLVRIRTIQTTMCYMQRDITKKCDRSTCEMSGRWDSWTADDSCGEGCAQSGDFNWFLPADDRVGDLPAPESQVDLSDSESDVDDVEPDPVPVQMTTTAVESLCPPVVTQTRPKEGCDPASPRRLRRGCDVLREDSMVAVDTRRISIDQDTNGIYVMPDCIPAVMPMLAAAPQAASEVAQTRPQSDCSVNLLLPVDGSIEPLDDDAPDVLSSGREPARGSSEVSSDVCVVQDLLPSAVFVRTVVAEMWMESFVLVPEPFFPVVVAGGGGGGRLRRHTPWSW